MLKKRRTVFDKLNTLLFGKDLRVSVGEPYTEVRKYDFSSYCPLEKYIFAQPAVQENVFDIRDFGADISKDDNAEFINAAVLKASECGGTVLVDGGAYITTPVILKSNVTLFITSKSSLCANKTGKGYEKEGAILFADGESDITLTGGGTLKGNGHLFGRKPVAECNNTTPPQYIDVIEMRRDYRAQLRFAHESKYGGLIYFKDCKNITVKNFILENSAYWTFKISNCENVSIEDFVINNNRNVANADGIDIAGTSNVKISHCFISTADDGIVIKNANWLGNRGAMENIDIRDCEIISRTNAVKVGTETTYDIKNISVTNCRLFMTDVYPGSVSAISLEACDGTVLSNVKIKDIVADRCTCALFIRLANRNRSAKVNAENSNIIEFSGKATKGAMNGKELFDMKSEIKNISVENLTATGVQLPIIIAGFKQRGRVKRVEDVVLKNIRLEYDNISETVDRRLFIPEYSREYPECWRFRNLPAYALWMRHTKNIKLDGFTCVHPSQSWKKEIIMKDCL